MNTKRRYFSLLGYYKKSLGFLGMAGFSLGMAKKLPEALRPYLPIVTTHTGMWNGCTNISWGWAKTIL